MSLGRTSPRNGIDERQTVFEVNRVLGHTIFPDSKIELFRSVDLSRQIIATWKECGYYLDTRVEADTVIGTYRLGCCFGWSGINAEHNKGTSLIDSR